MVFCHMHSTQSVFPHWLPSGDLPLSCWLSQIWQVYETALFTKKQFLQGYLWTLHLLYNVLKWCITILCSNFYLGYVLYIHKMSLLMDDCNFYIIYRYACQVPMLCSWPPWISPPPHTHTHTNSFSLSHHGSCCVSYEANFNYFSFLYTVLLVTLMG
jgi:hypothetical protein